MSVRLSVCLSVCLSAKKQLPNGCTYQKMLVYKVVTFLKRIKMAIWFLIFLDHICPKWIKLDQTLDLVVKKGLQNHINCRVPCKWLKFEKWSKGIKCSVFRYFHWPNSDFKLWPFSLRNEENKFAPTVTLIFDVFYGIGQTEG